MEAKLAELEARSAGAEEKPSEDVEITIPPAPPVLLAFLAFDRPVRQAIQVRQALDAWIRQGGGPLTRVDGQTGLAAPADPRRAVRELVEAEAEAERAIVDFVRVAMKKAKRDGQGRPGRG